MVRHVATIILAIGAIALGSRLEYKNEGQADPKRTVVPHRIHAEGRVEGASEELSLRPEFSGLVVRCQKEVGDHVVAGETLVQLDDRSQRAEVELAEATLAESQGHLDRLKNGARSHERETAKFEYESKSEDAEKARIAFVRAVSLHESRAISDQEFDNLRLMANSLRAQADAAKARWESIESLPREDEMAILSARVAAAKARLEMSMIQLERTRLSSPIDGVITDVGARVGEIIGPNSPIAAISVVDSSRVRIRAFIDEYDAMTVEPGMRALIHVDGNAISPIAGRVASITPRMTRKPLHRNHAEERLDTDSREIWIRLDDQFPCVLGLKVDVEIGADGTYAR